MKKMVVLEIKDDCQFHANIPGMNGRQSVCTDKDCLKNHLHGASLHERCENAKKLTRKRLNEHALRIALTKAAAIYRQQPGFGTLCRVMDGQYATCIDPSCTFRHDASIDQRISASSWVMRRSFRLKKQHPMTFPTAGARNNPGH